MNSQEIICNDKIGPGSFSRDIQNNISLVLLQELRPPLGWRMVISGWAQNFWKIPLLPNHQSIRRKSHTLRPSLHILLIKALPPKPLDLLNISYPFSLLYPAISASLFQTLTFWFGFTVFFWVHELVFGNVMTTTLLLTDIY